MGSLREAEPADDRDLEGRRVEIQAEHRAQDVDLDPFLQRDHRPERTTQGHLPFRPAGGGREEAPTGRKSLPMAVGGRSTCNIATLGIPEVAR
jgi:hypothetical protein